MGVGRTPGDVTEDPRRTTTFALIGLVAVAVVVVAVVLAFVARPIPAPSCVVVANNLAGGGAGSPAPCR